MQEVAPHILLLQNRQIAGQGEDYAAAFEARESVISGKEVFQATDDWREPIGSFIIADKADADIQAGHHITLKPGTSIKAGSRCRLHIQSDFNCAQAQFRTANNNTETTDVAPYTEEFVQSLTSQTNKTEAKPEFIEEASFNIYPNPNNTGVFNCQISTANLVDKTTVIVSDMLGKIIEQFSVTNNSYTIDLSNYSKGIYIVKLTTNDNTFTKKIIYE